MKALNEYLKQQALINETYDNCVVKTNNTIYNIIGDIDDVISEDIGRESYEWIDKYITESLCLDYDSDNPIYYWDNIYETLIKSHNYKKFVDCFIKFFDENDIYAWPFNSYKEEDTKIIKFFVKDNPLIYKIKDFVDNKKYNIEVDDMPQELIQLMNFFNYYFSSVRRYKDDVWEILVEPKYSKKVTDEVYNKYSGILYHVTHKDNVERILKRGLQLKGDKNLYRYIEPRINFILGIGNELNDRINKIIQQKGYNKDDAAVLKIDLNISNKNQHNKSSYYIDFYKDLFYKEGWSVYTYGLIHPRFISIFK
jgi:hypothetical protein